MKAGGQATSSMAKVRLVLHGVADGSAAQAQRGTVPPGCPAGCKARVCAHAAGCWSRDTAVPCLQASACWRPATSLTASGTRVAATAPAAACMPAKTSRQAASAMSLFCEPHVHTCARIGQQGRRLETGVMHDRGWYCAAQLKLAVPGTMAVGSVVCAAGRAPASMQMVTSTKVI
jgi:hypothetical protein